MRVPEPSIHSPLGFALSLICLAIPGLVAPAVSAAEHADRSDLELEILFQSPQLRIYRAVDRNGRLATVLTNLDAEGNLLDRGLERGTTGDLPAAGTRPAPVDERAAAHDEHREPAGAVSPAGGGFKVSLKPGDEPERPAGDGEVEVRGDAAGGTTIVININNLPPPPAPAPPPAREAVVVAWPVGYPGGIVGPIRYPENHHFLGYGPTVRSPSSFSALGLKLKDRFFPGAEEP